MTDVLANASISEDAGEPSGKIGIYALTFLTAPHPRIPDSRAVYGETILIRWAPRQWAGGTPSQVRKARTKELESS
jgi:hypothetical protein